MIEHLCREFAIDTAVRDAAIRARDRVRDVRYPCTGMVKIAMLRAFYDARISDSELNGTSGYGYDDAARTAYESLLAKIFGVDRALARISIVSGTHAIIAALSACVGPGERCISVAGRPYDTLRNAICGAPDSLVERGMSYEEVELCDDGTVDIEAVRRSLRERAVRAVFVQRSRGYAPRRSIDIEACSRIFAAVRETSPQTLILVDNCYGELVEAREPTHVGADLVMGSLIKNLGGSLAPAGGYVAGSAALVDRVASRLYAPGLGTALGPTLGYGRAFIQGLFLAPLVIEQVLRGLDFSAALFSELGYYVDPAPGARRTDIVQAIRLGNAELVKRFAEGLQQAMPLNARFRPEPGRVPGYPDPVIMSGGAFVAGATIELSCDAPMREPYEVYLQGGIVAEHAFLGALLAAQCVAA
ncbi:MAG: methionine gamma-lyase family protein [Candidatus Eremiobacteraeota bacterium]|nr:methionine gamma-lyase family protein [Candidatus Eremiobacteraeota bacterium]